MKLRKMLFKIADMSILDKEKEEISHGDKYKHVYYACPLFPDTTMQDKVLEDILNAKTMHVGTKPSNAEAKS